jgi:F-type H+-transporting ATPase subunit delta
VKADELSRKYATAVFSQALEPWLTSLGFIRDRLAANPSLVEKLQDSEQPFGERQTALDAIIPADTGQPVRNFMYAMLRDGDIGLLTGVVGELDRMTRGGPLVEVARVTTAFALSDDEKEHFRQKLRANYGDKLEVIFSIDSAILGGAIVQIGDKVIDGSVSTRLDSMSNILGVKQ